MTSKKSDPAILLVPGHWLGAWAWDEVVERLTELDSPAVPLTLPGLDRTDPGRASRTLDDQAAAVEGAITAGGEPVVVVAHSGATEPVCIALDRHPELFRRVIWVDSGPVATGTVFAADFPEGTEGLSLPPFDALAQQASLEGLSAEVLDRFRTRAVPEPGSVLRQTVELTNDARYGVPTTLVCCSIPGTQVMELAKTGDPMFAEVAKYKSVEYTDLPTGHWPMWSRPSDLARIISAASVAD